MGETAGICLASILLKEMRYLVYLRYRCFKPYLTLGQIFAQPKQNSDLLKQIRKVMLFILYHAVVTARKSIWVSLNTSLVHAKRTSKGCFNFKQGKISFSRTCVWHQTQDCVGNSNVSTTNNRYGQRLCLEAWHINMSNHALNRDDGAYLPKEHMHLISH